ncbi:MAG: thioredoxin family protein [Methylophilus sp.]|uniref:thioredoxin family protein n=1 Tax=Methylophilus sp. TaxID=29541 RepID=UPI003F9EF307
MASINPPACNFGWKAPEFNLPDVNGKLVNLQASMGPKGLLVMFICNHCPYVKAILPRLIADVSELHALGIHTVAIMSNDPSDYPEDSPANMKRLSEELALPFPYLFDETQQVAKAYDAVCTPDFFGLNKDFALQYRGRFDESRKEAAPESTRDLFKAMKQVSQTGHGPKEQVAGIGCSMKWKE